MVTEVWTSNKTSAPIKSLEDAQSTIIQVVALEPMPLAISCWIDDDIDRITNWIIIVSNDGLVTNRQRAVVERSSSSWEADPSGAIFQRGVVYRGLYFPSLSSSFRLPPLEAAYQRYSHRQRQKSLIVVNCNVPITMLSLIISTTSLHKFIKPR